MTCLLPFGGQTARLRQHLSLRWLAGSLLVTGHHADFLWPTWPSRGHRVALFGLCCQADHVCPLVTTMIDHFSAAFSTRADRSRPSTTCARMRPSHAVSRPGITPDDGDGDDEQAPWAQAHAGPRASARPVSTRASRRAW